MSNLVVDTLTNQDVQLCKAWVNFNGTGTVAIRASYNVSSITDNAVGDYTVNFTNAMADTHYSLSGHIARYDNSTGWLGARANGIAADYTTASARVGTSYQNTILADYDRVSVQVQGNS